VFGHLLAAEPLVKLFSGQGWGRGLDDFDIDRHNAAQQRRDHWIAPSALIEQS
jgi:hypothetical protein